jgi:hypothetical protein
LVVAIATVAALAAGAQNARAVQTCPRNDLLVPFSATSAGSESSGTCVRSTRGPTGRTRVDVGYSAVARALIGRYAAIRGVHPRKVSVVCWSRGDWSSLDRRNKRLLAKNWSSSNAGFVIRGGGVVNLSPTTCSELDRITYAHGVPTVADSAFPISTLVHESLHVAGVVNEAVTECFTMQLAAETTVRLGYDERFARDLAESLFRGYAAYGKQNPDYYTSRCRNGTRLDLRPATVQFP